MNKNAVYKKRKVSLICLSGCLVSFAMLLISGAYMDARVYGQDALSEMLPTALMPLWWILALLLFGAVVSALFYIKYSGQLKICVMECPVCCRKLKHLDRNDEYCPYCGAKLYPDKNT